MQVRYLRTNLWHYIEGQKENSKHTILESPTTKQHHNAIESRTHLIVRIMNNQQCTASIDAAASQVKAADHYNNIQTKVGKPSDEHADDHHTRGRSCVKTEKLHHQRSA